MKRERAEDKTEKKSFNSTHFSGEKVDAASKYHGSPTFWKECITEIPRESVGYSRATTYYMHWQFYKDAPSFAMIKLLILVMIFFTNI